MKNHVLTDFALLVLRWQPGKRYRLCRCPESRSNALFYQTAALVRHDRILSGRLIFRGSDAK